MPKDGFRSITVAGDVHDHISMIYQANKEGLRLRGINSFSAFVTYLMQAGLQVRLKPVNERSLDLKIPKTK